MYKTFIVEVHSNSNLPTNSRNSAYSCQHILQAYHSKFNDEEGPMIGNIAFLPLRTTVKGPAPRTGTY